MAIAVGDLTTDPAAQSFISVVDADAYLAPERNASWLALDEAAKEAALVHASRWLVASYEFRKLDAAGLAKVELVASRLAVESLSVALFAGTDTAAQVQSETVGPISVTYRNGTLRADAAGMSWPWLKAMLRGLAYDTATKWIERA